MALQPWIRPAWSAASSQTCSFNGAMALQPWIPSQRLAPFVIAHDTFNGAMALQPWIPGATRFSGKPVMPFNGAMALQPWIQPRSGRLGPLPYRPFNGAMALQPWIQELWVSPHHALVYLQWSHGPSAMDTGCAPSRGFEAGRPFNGAMALQPWIRGYVDAGDGGGHSPSMEPWPFSHGYFCIAQWIAALNPFNGAMALQPWIPGERAGRRNAC